MSFIDLANCIEEGSEDSKELHAVLIEDGFEELSKESFSVWIRLMLVPEEELTKGKKHLALILGIRRPTLDKYLKELAAKNYLELVKKPGVQQTQISVTKKAILMGDSRFIII